jgi:serine/threonine protein kinase
MFKARQKLGKYRIESRLANGGFAVVYKAMDTIEGIRVALKIPHATLINEDVLSTFRQEVRLTAKLDHANILPLKNASFINGHFVIVFPLGTGTFADRMRSRMSVRTALQYADQMIEAAGYAHRHRIIHCDIKPENVILFQGNRLRLTDFGIAKVAQSTVRASGSGTLGYMSPEQAMGKPSLRSDVFSLGLMLYRMLTGHLPDYPFDWPPPAYDRLKSRVHPTMIALIRKAIELDPRKRFRDANQMLTEFRRIKDLSLAKQPKATRRHR